MASVTSTYLLCRSVLRQYLGADYQLLSTYFLKHLFISTMTKIHKHATFTIANHSLKLKIVCICILLICVYILGLFRWSLVHFKLQYVCKVQHAGKCHEQFKIGWGVI